MLGTFNHIHLRISFLSTIVKPITDFDDYVNSKPDCTLPSSSPCNVVVIDDGDVTDDFSRPWLKIGSITLYDNDKLTIIMMEVTGKGRACIPEGHWL